MTTVTAVVAAAVAAYFGADSGAAGRLRRPALPASKRTVSRRRLRLSLLAALVGALAGWVAGGVLLAAPASLAGGLGGWFGLTRLETGAARRARIRVEAELPLTLELLAACLDAGAPLRVACETVVAVGPEATSTDLAQVSARTAVGIAEPEAWRPLLDNPPWREPVRDIMRCLSSGAALSGVLRDHANDARVRHQARRQEVARAVGVRTVLPLMCCFLPAFLLVGVVPVVAGLVGAVFGH